MPVMKITVIPLANAFDFYNFFNLIFGLFCYLFYSSIGSKSNSRFSVYFKFNPMNSKLVWKGLDKLNTLSLQNKVSILWVSVYIRMEDNEAEGEEQKCCLAFP